MAARRARRRFNRGKSTYIWTAALIELDVTTGSPVLQQVLANQADWSGAAGSVGATMMTMRGYVIARADDNVNEECRSRWLIVKCDSDNTTTTLNPSAVATYVDESVLDTGGFSIFGEGAQPTQFQYNQINVRAQRKMSKADDLRFVVSEEGSATGTKYWGLIRTLFKL